MEEITLRIDGVKLFVTGYDENAVYPWEKFPSISATRGQHYMTMTVDRSDICEIISALEEVLSSFPDTEITVDKYMQGIEKIKHLLPDDFEPVRYKDGIMLGSSKAEQFNLLWIPSSENKADAYTCIGELNEVDDDAQERTFELSEVKGLRRLRARRFDLTFDE